MASKLAFGGLAIALTHVLASRQKVMTEKLEVASSISSLLEARDFEGVQSMIQQLSTPGADGEYVESIKAVIQGLSEKTLTNIKQGQTAAQTNIDAAIKKLADLNGAADKSKKLANKADQDYFECVVQEQSKKSAVEGAQNSLSSSRSNEGEACQLQQDNKGFSFAAKADKYKLTFECDFSVAGQCDEKLAAFKAGQIDKITTDGKTELDADKAAYDKLQATCDEKKKERVSAQSALGDAESAFNSQSANCKKLSTSRASSACSYGDAVHSKCAAENDFLSLIAATKKAKGDHLSEVDRMAEWQAAATTKCMLTKSAERGLETPLAGADLDACAEQVKFETEVGVLDRKDADFAKLKGSNACVEGPISFFNGQGWSVPKGADRKSSDYTRSEYKPVLKLKGAAFSFCSGEVGEPDVVVGSSSVDEKEVGGIQEGYLIVDGNPKADGNLCGFQQKGMADAICADPTDTKVAGSRCCTDNSTRGASTCDAGKCSTMSMADAKSACEKKGMRLCQANEVMAGFTSGTGCWYDHHYVWTSKRCGAKVEDYLEPAPPSKPVPPSQKPGVKSGYLIIDGNPKSDGAACGFKQVAGLDEICADPSEKRMAGTRCCEDKKTRVYNVSKVKGASICNEGKCSTYTYDEAKASCEAKGMRLCQANELLAGFTSGTGCWYDHHYVWSSKKCGSEVEDYLEPDPAKKPVPPAQKAGAQGYWIIDGNPRSDGNNCGFVQQRGVDKICADPSEFAMAGTRCCGAKGRRGSSICKEGLCHTTKYADAKAKCEAQGQRLCTTKELMAGVTAGTGCWYDHHYVWSNETCSV